jgi:glycosyltransferase involved in cell wall biosynthesis
MRILQVLPYLTKGGAERVVVELSNALLKEGHEVTLILASPVDPALNQKFLDNKVRVKFVSSNSGNRILQYIKLLFWVARHWKALKRYDVIHCHLTYGLVFGFQVNFLRRITRVKNLRLIATCHVVGVGVSRTPRLINERLSYFFDAFVLMALDTQWRKFILSKKRRNIKFVRNGISVSTPSNESNYKDSQVCLTIGTISRLQAERKPWLFLEVFSHILKLMDGNVRFILGGEGPERESLSSLSQELGLSGNLSMPGLVQDPNLLFGNLDLYVTLNVEEVTGIAGLEAIFARIPVVGIQLSPNYTNGENDWIWSNHEPVVVARKIVEYLKNPNQLSLITKTQYTTAVERYSVERMLENYLALYRNW